MTFYSHSQKLPDGKIVGSKELKTHIKNVTKFTKELFSKNVNFSLPNDIILEVATTIAKFHDIGKYVPDFQNYLLGKSNYDNELKNHSRLGAYAAFCKLYPKTFNLAFLGYYTILYHHSNLKNFLDDAILRDYQTKHFEEILIKQKEKLAKNISIIENEINESNLLSLLRFPIDCLTLQNFRKKIRRMLKETVCENYFLINYLFSLLIEADKLDASENRIYKEKEIPPQIVAEYIKNFPAEPLKEQVRKNVLSQLRKINVEEEKIFTLTAPTGIGKTLTALNFVLELRKKLSSNNKSPKIIYALPFVNIIEQNLNVYNKTIGDKAKIIAHYQFSGEDIFPETETISNYQNDLMLTETWQADIIITSFVQLAETIISNKNKALKKFAHFADAIVILDEVQAIDIKKLPLIGSVIYFLSKFLNTRFLLMTATKPYIFELAEKLTQEKIKSRELLDNYDEVFKKFKRTQIIPVNINNIIDEDDFVEVFEKHWEKEKSALIVVNKVNRSICLFKKIKNFLEKNSFSNPVFYLSTNIIPANKLIIIEKIRTAIDEKKYPILVATQTVEAGVDLDFDIGFRDIAPLDSIIQVAGRINRYNKGKEYSPLYIVNFNDCKTIYGSITENIVQNLLQQKTEFYEPQYPELIKEYYDKIMSEEYTSFDYSYKFFDAICKLNYNENNDEFSIGDFRLIEENKIMKSVFIEREESEEAHLKFKEFLNKKISKDEFLKFKHIFYSHIIKVPKYYLNEIENHTIEDTEIICIDKDLTWDFYDDTIGFIRKGICEETETTSLIL